MKQINLSFWICLFIVFLNTSCSSKKIVVDGDTINMNDVEIIINKNALPSVKLAATELQIYLYKITHKNIAINTVKSRNKKFRFYVGESNYTKELGIVLKPKTEDIKLASGSDFLILIGKDTKFIVKGPLNKNYDDINSTVSKWDNITKVHYGHPMLILFKNYSTHYDIWENELKGTLNAVYEYLHTLGVRWYLPGDLGEVLPESSLIPFPDLNTSYKASFPVRNLYFYNNKFFMAKDDYLKWRLRLKNETGAEVFGNIMNHGMTFVHSRDEFKKDNATAFALIKGNRDISKYNYGTPCLSSESLFNNHIKFLKDYFNTFGETTMSIMPGDGFGEVCGCDLCSRKMTTRKGRYGYMSDYVWEYISNLTLRMAKETPGKDLSCFAYASYLEPPDNVKKFGKNFKLGICYPIDGKKDNEEFQYYKGLMSDWKNKLSNDSILMWDYFLYTDPKRNFKQTPVLFTKYIENEIGFLYSQKSYGKFIEVYNSEPNVQNTNINLAFDHLNIYLTSRLLWNAQESRESILNEYFNLFYGPATNDLKGIFDYIENNWRTDKDGALRGIVLLNLQKALKKTKTNSIYNKRIQFLIKYLTA